MTQPVPFHYFTDNWLPLSYFLSRRDLQSVVCTCRFINMNVTQVFENFIIMFFTKTTKEQEQYAKFLSAEVVPRLSAISPTNQVVCLFLGEKYRIQGLHKQAIVEFGKLNLDKIHPNSVIRPFVMTAQAFAAYLKHDLAVAKDLIERSFKINPTYALTLLCRFRILRGGNQANQVISNDEAVFYLQTIRTQDPENIDAKFFHAEALLLGIGVKKDEEQAKEKLSEIIQKTQAPRSLSATFLLSQCYKEQGDLDMAYILLKTIIEDNTLDDVLLYHKAHLSIAAICLARPAVDVDEVYNYLEKASSTRDLSELYSIAHLFVHKKLGSQVNAGKSIELCSLIITAKPDDMRARKMRGMLLCQIEEKPEIAFSDLYKAYELDKNDRQVQKFLIELLSSLPGSQYQELLCELLERYQQPKDKAPKAPVEVKIRSINTRDFAKEFEELLICAPTDCSVAQFAAEILFQKQDAGIELHRMLEAHVERLIKHYPADASPLLLLALIKSKIPGSDPKILWDLYTEAIKKTRKPVEYSEAVFLRADLFINSDVSAFLDYDFSRLKEDLLSASAYSTSPTLLLSAAGIFEKFPSVFENTYLHALKMALRAYRQMRNKKQDSDLKINEFIGGLYTRGGFGLIQSNKIADLWKQGGDESMEIEDCLAIGKSLMNENVQEAAFYFTIVFMRSWTPKVMQILLELSCINSQPTITQDS